MVRTTFIVQRIDPTENDDIARIRLISQDGQMELSFEILKHLFNFEEITKLDIYIDKIPPENVNDATILMQGDIFKVQKKEDVIQVFGSLGGLQLRFMHPKADKFFQAMDPLIIAFF